MSVTYLVEIDLRTRGGFQAPTRNLRGLDEQLLRSKRSARSLTDMLSGGLRSVDQVASGVVRTVAGLGVKTGFVGAAAGIGAVTYGVVGLNKELETTKISLGAIYSAQGMASDIGSGIDLATKNIVQMRNLSKQLPGEFRDLLEIMTTTAVPAFRAGVDDQEHLKMSARLMAAGVTAKMPLDQVAREAAQLIEGRSGAHNVLGMRLMGLGGDSAQRFNRLSAGERIERINTELDKYAGSIDVFGRSFEGVSSTFLDNAKVFTQRAAEPLFKRSRDLLIEANEWLDNNQATVNIWGRQIGDALVSGLETGIDVVQEWGPAVTQFASNAKAELGQIWSDWGPTVKSVAGALREALKDPGTIDKLILLGKIWMGVKAVRFVGGAIGTGIEFGGATMRAGRKAGQFVGQYQMLRGLGGAGAPGAGGIDTAASTAMTALLSFGGVAGRAVLALGPLGLAAGAAAAGLYAIVEHNKDREKTRILDEMGKTTTVDDALKTSVREVNDYLKKFQRELPKTEASFNGITHTAADLKVALDELVFATHANAAEIAWAALQVRQAAQGRDDIALARDMVQSKGIFEAALATQTMLSMQEAKDFLRGNQRERRRAADPHGPKGGAPMKVEIVVTSNSEPNRVARLVVEELKRAASVTKVSPNAPNYSAGGRF